MAQRIETIEELFRRLGGRSTAAKVLGVTPQMVWNWQYRNLRIPPEYFLEHQDLLHTMGIEASPDIWFNTRAQDGKRSNGSLVR